MTARPPRSPPLYSSAASDVYKRQVVLRYPTPAMAQQAGMSTEAFEDFYFDVCTLDYNKMSHAMDALAARMERTNEVHIKGPGTDLRFSIAGMPAIKCDGKLNIPDGEIYTAPVRDSCLLYTSPSPRDRQKSRMPSSA